MALRRGPKSAVVVLLTCGCPATEATEDAADTGAGTGDSGADLAGSEAASGADETQGAVDPRLAITADWQAGSLSLLDLDALAAGATTRDEVLVDTIDLSAYPPGPIQLEITPDGTTAVVSVSPGFFDGFVGNLIGATDVALEGRLLLVDIASRSVTADLQPAHVPFGIAIAPDGSTAYTANYGAGDAAGTTMSVIDLLGGAVLEDIEVGGRPEQVSLSGDGALGIINLASDGTIRVFETADPAGTLSTPLFTSDDPSDDPSDVDFIEGTDYAIVTNSIGPSSYAIVDISDPANPTLLEDAPPPGGVPYGGTPIPGTTDVLVTLTDFDLVRLIRVAAGSTPSSVLWTVDIPTFNAFPLGIAVDTVNGIALSGAPGDNGLIVVGLDGTGARTLPWLEPKSPTYVALQPD